MSSMNESVDAMRWMLVAKCEERDGEQSDAGNRHTHDFVGPTLPFLPFISPLSSVGAVVPSVHSINKDALSSPSSFVKEFAWWCL